MSPEHILPFHILLQSFIFHKPRETWFYFLSYLERTYPCLFKFAVAADTFAAR